jgi:hypothetical protein
VLGGKLERAGGSAHEKKGDATDADGGTFRDAKRRPQGGEGSRAMSALGSELDSGSEPGSSYADFRGAGSMEGAASTADPPGSYSELEELDDGARLLSAPGSLLLPAPKPGDWVTYVRVDSQCADLGLEPCSLRLPGGAPDCLGACLQSMRLGEVRAVKGLDWRIRLAEHVPRHELALGGVLDVLELTEHQKRPLVGMAVFFRQDGAEVREEIPISGARTALQEALLLLKVGERGKFASEAGVRLLEVTHVACSEDISPFGDKSLWKLSLKAPLGSFECPRLGSTVTAVVNGEPMSWTWGRGEVNNLLEFSTARIGSGEEAEIRASKDGELMFLIRVEHVGKDADYAALDVSYEQHANAVARELFDRGNAQLAWWHWDHLRDLLAPACCDEPEDKDAESQRALALQVLGSLSTCELHLGRTNEACQYAARRVALLGGKAAARDFLRLACAAAANKDEVRALEACGRGLALPTLALFEKQAFAKIKARVAKAQRQHLAAERAFCRRMFA